MAKTVYCVMCYYTNYDDNGDVLEVGSIAAVYDDLLAANRHTTSGDRTAVEVHEVISTRRKPKKKKNTMKTRRAVRI